MSRHDVYNTVRDTTIDSRKLSTQSGYLIWVLLCIILIQFVVIAYLLVKAPAPSETAEHGAVEKVVDHADTSAERMESNGWVTRNPAVESLLGA